MIPPSPHLLHRLGSCPQGFIISRVIGNARLSHDETDCTKCPKNVYFNKGMQSQGRFGLAQSTRGLCGGRLGSGWDTGKRQGWKR